MDRQLTSNLHFAQGKVPISNDCLPSTSRQVVKNYSQLNKQNKNGCLRYQNKQNQERGSISFTPQIDSNRNYLNSSKQNYRKKNANLKGFSHKERFVQANCKFVMAPFADYSNFLKDPDSAINWDSVEEVLFTSVNNEICCPVCLCSPVAAKITRCGHIYCWPCILHYLTLCFKEKNQTKCPICYEIIKKNELKSVGIINKIEYTMNDYLTFSLMKIRKNSTIALPANYDSKVCLSHLKRNSDSTLDLFSKMFTASSDYLAAIIEREKKELNALLIEYQQENMFEVVPYVYNAFEELEKREIEFKQIISLSNQLLDLSLFESSDGHMNDYVYFYQAEDGQHVYLHPLNVRMLKHEYGDLKSCPSTITAKIIELHGDSVNENVRKRYFHLKHLPLSCEFKIAEVQLDSKVISKETLNEFSTEINNRMKDRKRKEKEQNNRDRKIEIENKKKIYGIFPTPNFKLDNIDFPSYFENDTFATPSVSEAELGSPPPLLQNSVEFQSSFAKMLSTGGNDFNKTLPKKTFTPDQFIDEDSGERIQSMNITLEDFFTDCLKTSKKCKKGKKK